MKTILLYPFKLALSLIVICACIVWAIVMSDKFLKFWEAVKGLVEAVQGLEKEVDLDDYLGILEKERMN